MILLVTGAWQDAKNHIPELEKMGHEVIFQQYEKDPLPCPAEIIEGVICNGLFLDHKIEQFVNLRYIQLTSAGYDRVPVDYIRDKKIEIHNARGVYSVPMAEYALCGVLVLYKNMRQFLKQQETHVWQKRRNLMELAGSTVMIFGCGSVGRECARVFKAVGCRTIGVDICLIQSSHFSAVEDMAQADRLIGRGLLCNRQELIKRLVDVGYYRLSGYLYIFKSDPTGRGESFVPGTSLTKVWDLYTFDRQLRLVTLDAIERIEVYMRTQLAYLLAETSGAFGYLDKTTLPNMDYRAYGKFMTRCFGAYDRSKTLFIEHFKELFQ